MPMMCRKCYCDRFITVHTGLLSSIAKLFGKKLRRCLGCNSMVFVSAKHGRSLRAPNEQVADNVHAAQASPINEADPVPVIPEPPEVASPKQEASQVQAEEDPEKPLKRCPNCGSDDYRRSHRTEEEHDNNAPPMARCRRCGARFPHPHFVLKAA